ncbi:Bub1p related protein kinase [Cryptosporidium felis]|nr:Bub1p related protein kinase [Cryptosporidium felis]
MKGSYKRFFSFNIDSLKEDQANTDCNTLESDELSFEELGYKRYLLLEKENLYKFEENKENLSNVDYNDSRDLRNSVVQVNRDLGIKRLSILEPVADADNELIEVCEVIESLNLNSSLPTNDQWANKLSSKLNSCEKLEESKEASPLRSEDDYFLISNFGNSEIINPRSFLLGHEKTLLSMGTVSTMNPYHRKSRSFRESIMLNFVIERFKNYSKYHYSTIPYMLYQINLSSLTNKEDAPKLNQGSFKTGSSFTLEINKNYKRTFMLKKIIGSGANASVYSADVCTLVNNQISDIFSCAVKIQHKDLGLNIREIYGGLVLYMRNKKRSLNTSFENVPNLDKEPIHGEESFYNYGKYTKKDASLNGTARSSISTTYYPGSNIPSSRNSMDSAMQLSDIPNENSTNNSKNINSAVGNIQKNIGARTSLLSTPMNSIRRSSASSLRTSNRISISSNHSLNYADHPTEVNNLIEPIDIGIGITVFCITELFVVSQGSSGNIQNILTRAMMKGKDEKEQNLIDLEESCGSVGISILPTYFGASSLQNILNEFYLKSGVTMEEPVVLFLAYQFAEALLWFNELKLLHGDLKPDNILLYPNPKFEENNSELKNFSHPLIPEDKELPIFISIIDFGRSLDIGEIYKNTLFEGNCHAKSFLPPVMLENLPWLHHIDVFGIASTLHCLITGRYMELTKWNDEVLRCRKDKDNNGDLKDDNFLNVYCYRIKNQSLCLKRNWKLEFWKDFMETCINFCPILHSKSVPAVKETQMSGGNSIKFGPKQVQSSHVSQSIDEISLNINLFLKKTKVEIERIFKEDHKLKSALYIRLLGIRKQLQAS